MRCGLCPQTALTAWWQPTWQLERYLCGHCTHDRHDAMTGAGWQMVIDDREPARA